MPESGSPTMPAAGRSNGSADGAFASIISGRREAICLCAIVLLALLLRSYELERWDVWVDEANGILTAKEGFAGILDRLKRDSSPPLYYFLLHGWMGLFGDGPIAVRSMSVVASLGLVALVYVIGAREISQRAGAWAAFLVAISPSQIFFSQQARMYTLLPLFALLAWWFLIRTLRGGGTRSFAICMLATSLALYTHNFAVYVPLVLAVLVLLSGQFFRRFWLWGLAVVIQVLVYAPWLPSFLKQIENEDHYAWFLPLWNKYGLFGVIERSLRSFAPAGVYVMSPGAEDVALFGIPTLIALGLAVWGVVYLARHRRGRAAVDAFWIPVALVVPIVVSLAMSQVMTPHYVPGRVDQMLLPVFALLMGAGLSATNPAWLRRAIAPVFLGLSLIRTDVSVVEDRRVARINGRDADMAAAVIDKWSPNDVILCTSLTRAPLEYYLGRAGIEARILSFPRDTARHLGAQNDWRLVGDREALMAEAKIVLDEARRLTAPDGHLFVLHSDMQVNASLTPGVLRRRFYVYREAILGRFQQVGTGQIITAAIFRMHAKPPESNTP
jgi:4-amino-4-deoxy-L-arabinose transferase-like glycosyltransferase